MIKGMQVKLYLTALLLALSFPAFAEKSGASTYTGFGFEFLGYEEGIYDADFIAVNGKVGARINQYFAGEARISLGFAGDEINIAGDQVDIDMTYKIGAYLKTGVPLNEALYPYVLVGYSRAELEAEFMGLKADESESDTSFGFGLDIIVTPKITLNGEYANFIDKDGAELSGTTFGVTFMF